MPDSTVRMSSLMMSALAAELPSASSPFTPWSPPPGKSLSPGISSTGGEAGFKHDFGQVSNLSECPCCHLYKEY